MCGRYALHLAHRDIQDQLAAQDWIDQDQFVPRYNIAPRSRAPVLRRTQGPSDSEGGSSVAQDNSLILHTMKWGLVPHWSKFEDTKMNTINARAENLIEGTGMWNSIKGKKRCAVVADGYFEWLTKGKDKLPYLMRHKSGSRLMLMAGLYDSVVLEGQTEVLWTFTIVTTAANKDFAWLHDRQPVILSSSEALDAWLDTSSKKWDDKLSKLLGPYSDKKAPLECYAVPKEVGKVGVESPTFIEPIEKRKDGIEAMFAKQKAKPPSTAPKKKTLLKPGSPSTTTKRKRESSIKPASSSKNEAIEIKHSDDEEESPTKKKKVSMSDLMGHNKL